MSEHHTNQSPEETLNNEEALNEESIVSLPEKKLSRKARALAVAAEAFDKTLHYTRQGILGGFTGAVGAGTLTHAQGADVAHVALIVSSIATVAAGASSLKRAFTHGARGMSRDNVAQPLSKAGKIIGKSTATFMAAALAAGLTVGTANWETEDGILQQWTDKGGQVSPFAPSNP